MKVKKMNLEKVNKFMKFVANFMKVVYYVVKFLNLEP